MIEINEIYNKTCEEGLLQIDDKSIDFVCIDSPYTDGVNSKNDVLKNHKIQTKLDILAITKEHFRVLKNDSFYALFGMMPTILAWYNAAIESGFKFKQEIIWCKRDAPVSVRLNKVHESIFIFTKGEQSWYNYKDKYADIKISDTLFGLYNIESVFRELSYWISVAKGNNVSDGSNRNVSKKRNDGFYDFIEDMSNGASFGKSAGEIKLNTIWSFLPENKTKKNANNTNHPTCKPIKLLERLIKLCTPEDPNIIVLDSFMGSGTTALACQNTKRNFVGFEIDKDYFEICNKRLFDNTQQTKMF